MATPLQHTSLGELGGRTTLLTTSLGELGVTGPVTDFMGGIEDAYAIVKLLTGEKRDEADMILLLLQTVARIEEDR